MASVLGCCVKLTPEEEYKRRQHEEIEKGTDSKLS